MKAEGKKKLLKGNIKQERLQKAEYHSDFLYNQSENPWKMEGLVERKKWKNLLFSWNVTVIKNPACQ
jgi:hypothetical protein